MAEKVAVVHDWLNGMRGGEKVLEEILRLYPQADVFTLFYERDKVSDLINSHRVFASRLNRHRFVRRHYQYFLPLLPAHVEEFKLQSYKLVISTSHCVAKGAIPAPDALNISYIFSPMRYAWDQYHLYFPGGRGLKKAFIRRALSRLRAWDVASSHRVDHFIADSHFVRRRVEKYYRREAAVIHPPVDTDFFVPAEKPTRDFFLLVSALVPYKNIPLVIAAFNASGERLVIVGRGSEEKKLKRMAKGNIEFADFLGSEELRKQYQNAIALVFGGVEDFGIFFAEALACGTPVVAYGRGGVLDIITDGEQGLLFDCQEPETVQRAAARIRKLEFDPQRLRQKALEFAPEIFRARFAGFIKEKGA